MVVHKSVFYSNEGRNWSGTTVRSVSVILSNRNVLLRPHPSRLQSWNEKVFYFQQLTAQTNVSTTVYEEIDMELSGAQILVDGLKREGVEYIFGVNGGAAMPIFDALYDETDIKLIPMRHEQGASHAADGYARATGKVGVALGNFWSRRNKSCDRHCDCVYGFYPNGSNYWTGDDRIYRQ